jgi:ADP-heptose:LPS heptosyltransferase
LQTGGNDFIRKLTIEFINGFIEESSIPVILVGDLSEKIRLTDKISSNENVSNLLGETSLDELVELVCNALLVVAPDSFLIHLSGLLKVPCIALMGNALEETFGPDLNVANTCVISRKPYCSPCSKESCDKYNGLSCVQNIQVEEVIWKMNNMKLNIIS